MPCRPSLRPFRDALVCENLPGLMSTLVVEEMGGLDTSLMMLEDWDFIIRLTRKFHFESVCEPLAFYRRHSGNRSLNIETHLKPGFRIVQKALANEPQPDRERHSKAHVYATFYRMLSGGALHTGRYLEAGVWAGRAILRHPLVLGYIARTPFRMAQRSMSRRRVSPAVTRALGEFRGFESKCSQDGYESRHRHAGS